MTRRLARPWLTVAIVALATLTGIVAARWVLAPSPPSFLTTDITGAPLGGELGMADHTGTRRSLRDFDGKVVVVTFGFLNCPDVCPTTLATYRAVLDELGEDAKRVQLLMVTVDPERDTPDLLGRYVQAFHPTFLGLHGTPEELAALARSYRIVYEKRKTSPDFYVMEHSTSSFVHDTRGRLRLLVPHEATPAAIAHDVRQLLNERDG